MPSDFIKESEVDLDMEIRNDIKKKHLSELLDTASEYFPNLKNQDNYQVQNPFKIKSKPKEFLALDYKKLIQLSANTQLEDKFKTDPLKTFWSNDICFI